MQKFTFAGYNKQGNLVIKSIDLALSSYQRDFDCSDDDKAKVSLGIALVEDQTGKAVFIDLRDKNIDIEKLTQHHFHTMGKMYNDILDVPADTSFFSSYIAFAKSVCNPNHYFLSHQKICRHSGCYIQGDVSQFDTVQEGKNLRAEFISNNNLGLSSDAGGDVYRNGSFVGYINYVGRLWSDVFYGGRRNAEEINNFLDSNEN